MDYADLTEQQKLDVAKSIDCTPEELEQIMDNEDYIVLTDHEADEKAGEYIKETLWAFNPSFLAGETGIDQEVFEAIAKNDRCESNNDAIYSLVDNNGGIDSFIQSAISADGRGHFMSSYDGNEDEIYTADETGRKMYLYAYRMN